jgi:predicted metal-dependent hydrolase
MTRDSSQSSCVDRKTRKREMRCVTLNGKEVPYTLKRRRCRAIGMKIDCDGLTVSVPLRESLGWVESVLQDRAKWVLKKLDEWGNEESVKLVWEESAIFPLLGEPWQLATTASGVMQMTKVKEKTNVERRQLALPLSSMLTTQEVEKFVMEWYHKQALVCFSKRMAYYATKLSVPHPQLRLSRAKTQWGSCDMRGIVHLNWRLIQLSLSLVDYVVAHEMSHLIEMNHSSAFWKTVESIYPNYLVVREELRRLR